jgi:tetratricopeptide (TPR) repeat protein
LECQDRALQILERLLSESPSAPEHRRALALAHTNRGEALRNLGRSNEALSAHQSAVTIQAHLATSVESVPEDRQALARAQHSLADLLVEMRRYDEALALLERALAAQEQLSAASPTNALYQIELAGTETTMGNLRRDRGRAEAALEWYARSIDRIEELLGHDARLVQARRLGRDTHRDRAGALGQLSRHADALRDYDQALKLDDGQRQSSLRMERALARARLKEIPQALQEAESLIASLDADAPTLYTGAVILALASAAMPEQADRHGQHAVGLLRRALAKGYKDLATLKQGRDLDLLREREDFKRLLAEFEAKR